METPIFFISGFLDDWATPRWQRDYHGRVAGPRAMAAREGTGHFLVTDRSRGYRTAWLRYTLAGDALARSAPCPARRAAR